MQTVTLPQLNERLKLLPPDQLAVVYDFVAYLSQHFAQAGFEQVPHL